MKICRMAAWATYTSLSMRYTLSMEQNRSNRLHIALDLLLEYSNRSNSKEHLKTGVTKPAASEWAAPVLFVLKKDGQLRFCVVYRKPNEMTLKYGYSLLRINDCIDSLVQAQVCSTLEAYSSYW